MQCYDVFVKNGTIEISNLETGNQGRTSASVLRFEDRSERTEKEEEVDRHKRFTE